MQENSLTKYDKIKSKEIELSIGSLNSYCYRKRIITTTVKMVNFPIPGQVAHELPKINFLKLLYVVLVVTGLTIISIFFISMIYKYESLTCSLIIQNSKFNQFHGNYFESSLIGEFNYF